MNHNFESLKFTRECPKAGSLEFSAIAQGEGEIVICLHGFPDHALSYRHQLPVFAEAGYRAIAPTLRGYEPSSIPKDKDYGMIRIAEDILACIDQLRAEKVHLVGHDWGAVVSYVLAAIAPERFYSMTTMAVPHVKRFNQKAFKEYPIQLRYSWYMFFFQLRGVSDFVVGRKDFQFIRKLWQNWCPTWELPEEDINAVIETLAQPGVKKAALSYYRDMFNLASKSTQQSVKAVQKRLDVPTLAITGADDGCIHTGVFQDLMLPDDFSQELRVEQIVGAGHFLHQEKPEQLNALMLEWFKQHAE